MLRLPRPCARDGSPGCDQLKMCPDVAKCPLGANCPGLENPGVSIVQGVFIQPQPLWSRGVVTAWSSGPPRFPSWPFTERVGWPSLMVPVLGLPQEVSGPTWWDLSWGTPVGCGTWRHTGLGLSLGLWNWSPSHRGWQRCPERRPPWGGGRQRTVGVPLGVLASQPLLHPFPLALLHSSLARDEHLLCDRWLRCTSCDLCRFGSWKGSAFPRSGFVLLEAIAPWAVLRAVLGSPVLRPLAAVPTVVCPPVVCPGAGVRSLLSRPSATDACKRHSSWES